MTTDTRALAAYRLYELGNRCAAAGSAQEALQFLRGALALQPSHAGLLLQLGAKFDSLLQAGEALECYRRALEITPGDHRAINDMGNALAAAGRFEEAALSYRIALGLAPTCGSYYRNLVECSRLTRDSPYFNAMEMLMHTPEALELDDRVHLSFAYGKALTGLGEIERGFEHLREGNRLHRQRIAYDEATVMHLFATIRRTFTAELLHRKAGNGYASPAPVFVVGLPRSGSTLVEQILASHPQVVAGGELKELQLAMAQIFAPPKTPASSPAGAPPFRPMSVLHGIEAVSGPQLRELGAQYVRRVQGLLGNPPAGVRLIDKMPFNFAYLGLIHLALPNARFIHTRREPVETCLSCFSRFFNNVPFSYDLGELGRYHHAYDALMTHWRAVLPEGVMIEVHYEDVVADLEREARRLVAHTGLEWHDACLAFHETERAIVTASAAQVRQPIYRSSVKTWRPAAPILQPLLDGLRYSRDGSW
ncbi:MAG: sulfotransferase [Pararobbsia sp.]